MRYEIVPLAEKDLGRLKAFTDRAIGAGYYSEAELKDIFNRSSMNGVMCSFLLVARDSAGGSVAADATGEIFGVRFTYPPGNWSHGKGEGLTPDQWPHEKAHTAYFQSLFLSDTIQGQGFGSKLSQASIDVLKEVGARGVVCHSW
jgi:GNAT superfamily N-acetyltransferase